jgi:hypothetical protein
LQHVQEPWQQQDLVSQQEAEAMAGAATMVRMNARPRRAPVKVFIQDLLLIAVTMEVAIAGRGRSHEWPARDADGRPGLDQQDSVAEEELRRAEMHGDGVSCGGRYRLRK